MDKYSFVANGESGLDSSVKYIGSHLHNHYSGYVKYSTILTDLEKNWSKQVFYNKNNGSLSFVRGNIPSNFIKNINLIRESIQEESDMNSSFYDLGGMFYGIIKDVRYQNRYLELIRDQMRMENIDHLELRLKLGSLRNVDGTKISIQDELSKLRYRIGKMGISIKIIPSASKHDNPNKVYLYFRDIIDIIVQNKYLLDIVCAFDIVGHEDDGYPLSFYTTQIEELISYMNKINIKIPFIIHVGETGSQKSIQNIYTILDIYKRTDIRDKNYIRLGHGIYGLMDPILINRMYRDKVILEFCPVSNDLFGNTNPIAMSHNGSINIIDIVRGSGIRYSINADDTNKLQDNDLIDNIIYLRNIGFTDGEIIVASLNGILGSEIHTDAKGRMIQKWYDTYILSDKNFNYVYCTSPSLSLDKESYYQDIDRKWPSETNSIGMDLLTKYISIISSTMNIARDKLLSKYNGDPNHVLSEILMGINLYKFKPSKISSYGLYSYKSKGTWSSIIYHHIGFQYIYLRFKSIQRFVETWSMLERLRDTNILDIIIDGKDKFISMGGGPGFELYTIKLFMDMYRPLDSKKFRYISIDLEPGWKDYALSMGIEFIPGTFDSHYMYDNSIFVFSYVTHQYIHDTNLFKTMILNGNDILINERVPLPVLKLLEKESTKDIHIYRLIKGHDLQTLITSKDIQYNIKQQGINQSLTFKDIPYIK